MPLNRRQLMTGALAFEASGWGRPDRSGWEEVPYWLRGYTDLALVTGDATSLAAARQFVPDGDGWYRVRNQHSGKVLGVDGMSTVNGAHIVQYDDNGTADHLWQLL